MDRNLTSRPHKSESENIKDHQGSILVLHNDDVNSFDYVIESLVEVCDHSPIQAEQCTMIAHYKGKCEVKSGDLEALKAQRYQLVSKGLKATIE